MYIYTHVYMCVYKHTYTHICDYYSEKKKKEKRVKSCHL